MVILHIARIIDDPCNGVCVVVAKHVKHQQNHATVGLININNYAVPGLEGQLEYKEPFSLADLPSPFDKPDIVVFHELYRPPYLKIYKALKKAGVPYVIVPHGEMTKSAQKKKRLKKIAANILLFNRFAKNAAAIQCLSQQESDAIEFKQNKIVATNGMDIPERTKTEFSGNGIRFLYIGRLDAYHKGLDLLIEAVAECAEEFEENNCKVYIYGPDYKGRYAHLEQLISDNNVGKTVRLNREIIGSEKEQVLLDCDCFIQTSRFEGMPLGILEAMSYGLPCIVTEGTTLGEFVRNNDAGWACDTTADAIADAMRTAISQKEKFPDKSKNAIDGVKNNFDWNKIAERTINLYSGLIAK